MNIHTETETTSEHTIRLTREDIIDLLVGTGHPVPRNAEVQRDGRDVDSDYPVIVTWKTVERSPKPEEPSSASLIAYLESRKHQVSCRKVASHFGVPVEMIRDLMKSYSTGYDVGKNGMIFKRNNRWTTPPNTGAA